MIIFFPNAGSTSRRFHRPRFRGPSAIQQLDAERFKGYCKQLQEMHKFDPTSVNVILREMRQLVPIDQRVHGAPAVDPTVGATRPEDTEGNEARKLIGGTGWQGRGAPSVRGPSATDASPQCGRVCWDRPKGQRFVVLRLPRAQSKRYRHRSSIPPM